MLLGVPPEMFLNGIVHTAGSANVQRPWDGTGLLVVDGDVDVEAPLSFTGVIVVSGGVRISARGALSVHGFLWIRGSRSGAAIEADGPLTVLYSQEAVATTDRLFTLPRRAMIRAERELYDLR